MLSFSLELILLPDRIFFEWIFPKDSVWEEKDHIWMWCGSNSSVLVIQEKTI